MNMFSARSVSRLVRSHSGGWVRGRTLTHKSKERHLRSNLIKKYGQCILTGWSNPLEYQAAHIVPRHVGYALNYQRVNSDDNCMLLTNTLHTIFDDMVWTFNMKQAQPDPTDNTCFTTGILVRPSYPVNKSILSSYVSGNFKIPSVYIPSMYLHYKVFLDQEQGQGQEDIKYLYDLFIKSRTYKKLLKVKTEPSCVDSLNIIKKSQ